MHGPGSVSLSLYKMHLAQRHSHTTSLHCRPGDSFLAAVAVSVPLSLVFIHGEGGEEWDELQGGGGAAAPRRRRRRVVTAARMHRRAGPRRRRRAHPGELPRGVRVRHRLLRLPGLLCCGCLEA